MGLSTFRTVCIIGATSYLGLRAYDRPRWSRSRVWNSSGRSKTVTGFMSAEVDEPSIEVDTAADLREAERYLQSGLNERKLWRL